jgi:nucleoside-diphosphate-sugar epimerase
MGTINIFEAAKEHMLSGYDMQVLYLSTDKVYGHGGSKPYLETSCLNGYGIYDCSKACGDLIARAYCFNYNIPTVVVRASNIYGPADLNSRIIPNTIRRCLHGESPLLYKGITYVREFTYIDDACRALITLMDNVQSICNYGDLDPNKPESRHRITDNIVFNVGSGISKTQEEVIRDIMKHFPGISQEYVEPQRYMAKEIPYQTLDSSKIRKEFGWKPLVDIEEGLKKTIEWWRAHPNL